MNIVLLCNEYPSVRAHAGIGTVVQVLARGLHLRGHKITVVGIGGASELSDDGVRIITLPQRKLRFIGNLLSRLELRSWLADFAKAEKIDLIEVPDSQGLLPFGFAPCQVVVRLHLSFTAVTHVTGEKHGRGLAFYESRNLAANLNWIGVSKYVLDLTRETFRVNPKRSVVIHNPAPPVPAQLPQVPDLPSDFVLFAGHVCARKGADVLASAAKQVMIKDPHIHLVYLGDVYQKDGRPISDSIRQTLGPTLSTRVHFLGRLQRDTALACMARARVFAFPTWVEGFPMVILEAMRNGLPVVYSKDPAGSELIEDGVSGLLADQRSPQDFGEKIWSLLSNPSMAQRIGEKARERVSERFSIEGFLQATEQFYYRCMN